MKLNPKFMRASGLLSLILAFIISPAANAASQSLGKANSFVILSGTFSNSVAGTTLNGDLGYTTPPATAPTLNGTTHVADSVYNQAGIDQGNALSALNNLPCTFKFAPGPIDLSSDTTHGSVGVYLPGVYCISGAASIGGGGTITLTGVGTYVFRMDGALNTSANSIVTAAGASACDVWWTPTAASTLGANSTFLGTNIDASGVTIGNNVTWNGQALSFGGTVSTIGDTITVPACPAGRAATPSISSITPKLPNTGFSNAAGMPAAGILAITLISLVSLLWFRKTRKASSSL